MVRPLRSLLSCLLASCIGVLTVGVTSFADPAPVPVTIGAGSYASFPPSVANGDVQKILSKQLSILNLNDRPIPTNKWWTDLIVDQFSGQLWAFPMMVSASANNLSVVFPQHWNDSGRDPVNDNPVKISGEQFAPTGTFASKWGDWNVTFRYSESDTKYMDVTLVRGEPYVWVQCTDVVPVLELDNNATFFTLDGTAVALPTTGDTLGISEDGRNYALYAPDGTRFEQSGDQIACEFTGPQHYFVLCALTKPVDISYLHKFAFALPTDTRMTWGYSPAKAEVETHWHVDTLPLKGTNTSVVQGWLPHHYRDTTLDFPFNGLEYFTPRGTMKCASGNDFTIHFPFNGILPVLPAPRKLGLIHDYDPDRMHQYLSMASADTKYADDTYWGGKDLGRMADYMFMAHETGDPLARQLHNNLATALADWYTYTPGETAHYFARYPNWHALIGFKSSYGSEGFNDNHFHYGYFTRATALLGMLDPDFLAKYGGMAELVAKQYANWDRTDTDFPYLRTFDIWEGHSWASGLSSPTGDNQESSSEAVQSWVGLLLLGQALHNNDMTACGAMGYAMETRAVNEYWLDKYHTNISPNFKHPVLGMVWSGGDLYGTYFSGDPAWIYGIQWLPWNPGLQFLAKYPSIASSEFQAMFADRVAQGMPGTVDDMGSGLGNVVLSFQMMFDPETVAAKLDSLWDANSPVVHADDTGGLTYYNTHSLRALGHYAPGYTIDLPCSYVYYNAQTATTTYVAFNATTLPVLATVSKNGVKAGTFTVPAGQLIAVTSLK